MTRGNYKNIAIGELDEFMRWKVSVKLGGNVKDLGTLRRAVPWLFRGIEIIADKVAAFPFEILDANDEVIDSSDKWTNELGFTGNLHDLLWLISSSLDLRGGAYVLPQSNRLAKVQASYSELKYFQFDTIRPKITEKDGLTGFVRRIGNQEYPYTVDELIWFWGLDSDVEIGPPLAYPGQAALHAAGVLFSLDEFFENHARSGLVKAFVASVKGLPPGDAGRDERTRIEKALARIMTGIKNIARIVVAEAEGMEIIPVGEGLKELENVTLTKDKREDISVALGLPMSILWSTEATGLGGSGVTKEDTWRLYDNKVVPRWNFIARILNDRLFSPLGYTLSGRPEALDVFQEDEVSRSTALANVTSAISESPEVAKFAMQDVLGYELSDEAIKALDLLIAGKQERAAQMAQLQSNVVDVTPQPRQLAPGESPAQKRFREDLALWQRKVENRLRANKSAQVDFVSDAIDADSHARIFAALAEVKDGESVKAVFQEAQPSGTGAPFRLPHRGEGWQGYP